MKKRNLLIAVVVVFAIGLFPACDLIEECGKCIFVTDDGSGNVTEGTPVPLCGEALKEREDQLPITVGSTTTYWECN